MIAGLWVALWAASSQAAPYEVTSPVWVRAAPIPSAAAIGRIEPGAVFEVADTIEGKRCDALWGELQGGGYVCMAWSVPATGIPGPPATVRFDPPEPAEYQTYRATGIYDRSAEAEDTALPFVYARRWFGGSAPVYASAEAFRAGLEPTGTLGARTKAHFSSVRAVSDTLLLIRADGTAVSADDVFLFPISRFRGRDLTAAPPALGTTIAWVLPYGGTTVHASPSPDADVVAELAFQTAIDVVDGPDRWLRAAGGWILADAVRIWRPVADPPIPQGRWVDVDLDQQVLTLFEGEEAMFATLVSTGLPATPTPTGTWHVRDKVLHSDMRSRPGSTDPYHVEEVPWVVHFRPRYALHGTFWHWGFGHPASHGCVNLSPQDARTVFAWLEPALPAGWHTVYAEADDSGTPIRIRGSTP